MKAEKPPIKNRGKTVSGLVAGRVTKLQEGFLEGKPYERGLLAILRRSFADEPGQNPKLWELEMIPDCEEIAFDRPTWEEYAVHHSLTLYAWHQQSKTNPMHSTERKLGQAIAKLAYRKRNHEGLSKSVRSRFDAAVTSRTEQELVRHLRGLIGQLRVEEIGFNYAALAQDLYNFQAPGGAKSVRLNWARQFAGISAQQKEEK